MRLRVQEFAYSELYFIYDLNYKEVNNYQHKRATHLTAKNLVRLIFRLPKNGQSYIPAVA